MNTFLLISHDAITHERKELGKIVADSAREAALFLAYHFPNDYFLSNVITLDEHDNPIGTLMIASKEAYEADYRAEGLSVPSPVELATRALMMELSRQNSFCDVHLDRGDVCYRTWTKLKSVDGRIVKDITEEV